MRAHFRDAVSLSAYSCIKGRSADSSHESFVEDDGDTCAPYVTQGNNQTPSILPI